MHKVLVVEDDHTSRTLLFALLTNQGMTCDGAEDGAEAIAKLRQKPYCAILLDLLLPDVNGFEVLRFLRVERPDEVGRVIIVTAACDTTLRDFDSGDTFHLLRKPYDIGEVRQIAQRCAEQCGIDHTEARTDLPEGWGGEMTPPTVPGTPH
jgi:two-component system, NtrC family, response regulator HydG